jgi:hypothetical protein
VKTTLEMPDELFRQTKATAALRGESLRDFVAAALRAYLQRLSAEPPEQPGWRAVFGQARREQVEEVDRILAEELERVEPDSWR